MAVKLLILAALAAVARGGVIGAPVVAPAVVSDATIDPNPQYSFAYDVQDTLTGDSKSQVESRANGVVRGQYSVADPDGTRRIVDYYADPVHGFNAIVRRAPLVAPIAPVVAGPAPIAPVVAARAPIAPVVAARAPIGPVVAAPGPYAAAPGPYAAAPGSYAAAPGSYAAAPGPYAAAPSPYFTRAITAPLLARGAPVPFAAAPGFARLAAPAPLGVAPGFAQVAAPLAAAPPLARVASPYAVW